MCLLKNVNKIHMIGIGGAGMCAMAQILYTMGYTITGSDNNCGDNTERLEMQGIEIYYEHSPLNIGDADLCVYTAAILKNNPELMAAKATVPTISRAEMLGEITKMHENVVAVAGTHGKTTTCAMLTEVLIKAEKNPSAVVGGHIPIIHGNGILGDGDIMVCEACEFSNTFLNIKRDISVILNIDNDHLEQFHTIENLTSAFAEFVKPSNTVIVWGDDAHAIESVKKCRNVIKFGYDKKNDYTAENIKNNGAYYSFDIYKGKIHICEINLKIPGKHNILNALAAAVAALELGVDEEEIKWGINSFCGASRRFEIIGNKNGVTVVDDYAHHPAEIKAVLETAKNMEYKRIIAVFQPFTYSRTRLLMNEFAESLSVADLTVLTEIMGGREENLWNVSSGELAVIMNNTPVFDEFEKIADYIANIANNGDLVITLGCGDIYKCARKILKKL